MVMDGIDYTDAVSRHRDHPDDGVIRGHLSEYASRGITFIRDGGDNLHVTERARELAREFGIDYRSPIFAIHKNGHYGRIVGRGFDDLAGYARLVEEADRHRADFVKIMTTGIMDFHEYGRVTGTALDAAEVTEMVHIAHLMGLSVMVHANGKRAVLEAIEAGADSIEHANFIDRDCLDAFAETGCVYVPTATVARSLIGSGHGDAGVLARIWEQSRDNLIAAWEHKGVYMALGSDGGAVGVPHGTGLMSEYQCFKDAIGEGPELDERLEAGEARIRERFQRHWC
jgi:imidazolonepropionase-like amidohydrolase